jgi:hypothetical protein
MMHPGRILVQHFDGGVSVELELMDAEGNIKATAEITLTPAAAERVAGELMHHAAFAPESAGPVCRHETSLYGRCVDCGATWEQQAAERVDVDPSSPAIGPGSIEFGPEVRDDA